MIDEQELLKWLTARKNAAMESFVKNLEHKDLDLAIRNRDAVQNCNALIDHIKNMDTHSRADIDTETLTKLIARETQLAMDCIATAKRYAERAETYLKQLQQ